MAKKRPLPKYLEGTLDCKQGHFAKLSSRIGQILLLETRME